ncbi:MAG: hypothetical protein KAT66_09805 [Candidatus Lokiarchaeota archaeon]|nr:hypothetical protein [Candidatus Lokiarchaeota archaeon]
MNVEDFIKQLNKAQDLMIQEKYNEAINLIEEIKEIEKKSDFDYNLTHRLYQLDSNIHSLYNQQVILNHINDISRKQESISFQEINLLIKKSTKLDLSDDILRREIELLILRNLLNCKIDGDLLKF